MPVTFTGSTPPGSSARAGLAWFCVVAGIALTALAVYDLANGERNPSLWVAVICWPLVAISGGLQLIRIRGQK
ncbi:hypothetical protein BH683_010695 [Williamsia sp. 1138]|nr:hypothetical protein BH683_010695 [Williamsia sp. 1138]